MNTISKPKHHKTVAKQDENKTTVEKISDTTKTNKQALGANIELGGMGSNMCEMLWRNVYFADT
eukprot:2029519-Lingulodinium_polyedra.AAC.1